MTALGGRLGNGTIWCTCQGKKRGELSMSPSSPSAAPRRCAVFRCHSKTRSALLKEASARSRHSTSPAMKWLLVFGLCAVALGSMVVWENNDQIDSGHRFIYNYSTQVASGMPLASDLHSMIRLNMHLNFVYLSRAKFVLEISDISAGILNEEMQAVDKLISMEKFERVGLDSKLLKDLKRSVFIMTDKGVITGLKFHKDESEWSKNIKRAALTLFSVDYFKAFPSRYDNRMKLDYTRETENTVEGICTTRYSHPSEIETDEWTMTKDIDFTKCAKLSDIEYDYVFAEILANKTTGPKDSLKTLHRSTTFSYIYSRALFKKINSLSTYVVPGAFKTQAADVVSTVVSSAEYITEEATRERYVENDRYYGDFESLLYYSHQDSLIEKFEMNGDEALEEGRWSPRSIDMYEMKKLMEEVAVSADDRTVGVSYKNTLRYATLVEVFRTMKMDDLESLYEKLPEIDAQFTKDLYFNLLASAGTRNTLKVLVEKTLAGKANIDELIAQVLKTINVRKPSEKQIDEVLRLCRHEILKTHQDAFQSCWLSAGSMANKWVKIGKDLNKKDVYNSEFRDLYMRARLTSEKIVALKAWGNCGLFQSLSELQKIIMDKSEKKLVRIQAIDSLRLLREKRSPKIHDILLPVFQDTEEKPEIRMSAVAMILSTIPEKSMLNHIVQTISRDSTSSDVDGNARRVEESPRAPNIVLHRVDYQPKKPSIYHQYASYFYSSEKQSGLLFNFFAIPEGLPVPTDFSYSLDALVSGDWHRHLFQYGTTFDDMDAFVKQTVDYVEKFFGYEIEESVLRGERISRKSSRDMLKDLLKNLRIKSRKTKSDEPLVVVNLRIKNFDYSVKMIDMQSIEKMVAELMRAYESRDMKKVVEYFIKDIKNIVFHMGTNNYDTMAKIPTMFGMPLIISKVWTTIADVKSNVEMRDWKKLVGGIYPMLTTTFVSKCELKTPFASLGVKSTYGMEINLPQDFTLDIPSFKEMGALENFKLSLKTPEQKLRLLSYKTLPVTFVQKKKNNVETKEIKNRLLTFRTFDEKYEKVETYANLPMVTRGHGCQMGYESPLDTLMTCPYQLEVMVEPTSHTPKEIIFSLDYTPIEEEIKTRRPRSSTWDQSDEVLDFSDSEDSELADHTRKHSVTFAIDTSNSRNENKMEVVADWKLQKQGLEASTIITRSPIRALGEKEDWKMNLRIEMKMTPLRSSILRSSNSRKLSNLATNIESSWGLKDGRQQYVKLDADFDYSKEMLESMRNSDLDPMEDINRWNQIKFKISHDLDTYPKELIYAFVQHARIENLWSTVVEPKDYETPKNELVMLIDIDRNVFSVANVTLDMPSSKIVFHDMALPIAIPKLSSTSILNAPHNIVYPTKTRECIVKESRIETFTNSIISLPNKHSKCRHVIVKDCSLGEDEFEDAEPKFAVLSKQHLRHSDKSLVILTDRIKIEAELEDSYEKKMIVKVNGKRMHKRDMQKLESIGLTLQGEELKFENADIKVVYDGKIIRSSVSSLFKSHQCGLCVVKETDSDKMFPLADNTFTDDVSIFHESYVEKVGGCADH
ncbi:hypothetical protein L596_005068 [Steinernema carpocapsae]|uniref:Vitellogenin domain-containing protein n=1 Tax=Steinernema carpocapsae TaxID=34508 RepID=A0A4U8UY20_STECR|nr:hypothetical protein L596_005068 [Steinernema carpocapsae]